MSYGEIIVNLYYNKSTIQLTTQPKTNWLSCGDDLVWKCFIDRLLTDFRDDVKYKSAYVISKGFWWRNDDNSIEVSPLTSFLSSDISYLTKRKNNIKFYENSQSEIKIKLLGDNVHVTLVPVVCDERGKCAIFKIEEVKEI